MADEPVLQEGVSSEWVQYLEQLLQQAGYWNGSVDGEFTSDLTAAVVSYQQAAGLSATGTVDQSTWDSLTGAGSSSSSGGGTDQSSSSSSSSSTSDGGGAPDSGAATGDGGYTGADGSTGYSDGGAGSTADGSAPDSGAPTGDGGYTGADGDGGYTGYSDGGSSDDGASSSGGDASSGGAQISGLPAFQLTAPAWPLWQYDTDTGTAAIHVDLTLTGSLQATFTNPPLNVGLDLSNGAWAVEASNTLNQLSSSLSVSGLGTESPAIGCTLGNQFETWGESFQPPNTVKFTGQANISYTGNTSMGPCTVQGTPGFELAVTITPHQVPDPEPVDAQSFWEAHHEAIEITGGVIVLIGLAALTVATFGADSPVTVPAMGATAAAL